MTQSIIGVVSKKLDGKIKDTPPTEMINILIKNIEDFEAGEASTSYMLNDKYKVTITVEDIEE